MNALKNQASGRGFLKQKVFSSVTLFLLVLVHTEVCAVWKAVKRLAHDFTGNGKAETLVLYQDEEKGIGHITIYGKRKGKSFQLWNSSTLPIVDVRAEDANGDHISDIVLFTSRRDGLLDVKILEYSNGSWHSTFREVVADPEDIVFIRKKALIELHSVHSGNIRKDRRLYAYVGGKYQPVREQFWEWEAADLEQIKEVSLIDGIPGNAEILLLARTKEKGKLLPYLLNPRTGSLLGIGSPQSAELKNLRWLRSDLFAAELCERTCFVYLIEYPEGKVKGTLEGSLAHLLGNQLLIRKLKAGELFSFYLVDALTLSKTYLFDAAWAAFLDQDLFVYYLREPGSGQKIWKMFDLRRGHQEMLRFSFAPEKVVAFPGLKGFLAFDKKRLFFVPLQTLGEELWYVAQRGETIKDVSPSVAELNVFVSVDGRENLRHFSVASREVLWSADGIAFMTVSEEGNFSSDGEMVYRVGTKHLFPLWGGKRELVKTFGKEFFVVQVGSSPNQETALKLYQKLIETQELRQVPVSIRLKRIGGDFWYRVNVGRAKRKEDLSRLVALLQEKGFDTWITKEIFF